MQIKTGLFVIHGGKIHSNNKKTPKKPQKHKKRKKQKQKNNISDRCIADLLIPMLYLSESLMVLLKQRILYKDLCTNIGT